jgi:membrane-bound serine protease (ClpP class)
MREGASIGAATVVNQEGKAMPDKYQSFMRSMMRSTAEAHGKDTSINGKDTIISWHRDPKIAEAMVDPRTYIPGINDTGKVLTFTTEEAIKHKFCEGKANSINEIIEKTGIKQFSISHLNVTKLDKAINFLLNPIVQGILIMLIVAGLYYELQSPGIGFPLILAVSAAILYFAPLYVEGLAEHWEILLFIAGLILIIIEIFAIPGFGIIGISGIALAVVGLTLAMIDNFTFKLSPTFALTELFRSLFIVLSSLTISIIGSIYLSNRLLQTSYFNRIALKAELADHTVLTENQSQTSLIGEVGVAQTTLRPSGKTLINNEIYDSIAENGYIEAGQTVKVVRYETGQIYVKKLI